MMVQQLVGRRRRLLLLLGGFDLVAQHRRRAAAAAAVVLRRCRHSAFAAAAAVPAAAGISPAKSHRWSRLLSGSSSSGGGGRIPSLSPSSRGRGQQRGLAAAAALRVPAAYMRGGTSKGVIFRLEDLPVEAREPGEARDSLMLRVVGCPDPYLTCTDGMGGATSSTSKVAIVSKSTQKDHDVDYLFGQLSPGSAQVDWSGGCGNLVAAVGAFAVEKGLVDDVPNRIVSERNGGNGTTASAVVAVRIWQSNAGRTIVAHVPVVMENDDGCGQVEVEVVEDGDFAIDGVAFPSAEVKVDFVDPAGGGKGGGHSSSTTMFPTGNVVDELDVPGLGSAIEATLVDVGIPTVFVDADDDVLGCTGAELQPEVNGNARLLESFESIRVYGAVRMGLVADDAESVPQHTPKVAFVSPPASYVASDGRQIDAADVDLNVRALSMGKLHHAMMGTVAVAIGAAAAVPGTLVHRAASASAGAGRRREKGDNNDTSIVTFGHPSGTMKVGADVSQVASDAAGGVVGSSGWKVHKVSMSRSARVLMEGWVRVPGNCL